MVKIKLEGWRDGLEKVSLTKLQVEMLGKSLKESKRNVDLLLANTEVIVEIDGLELVNDFLREADKIGVNCNLLQD